MKKIIIYLISITIIIYLLVNGYNFAANNWQNVSIGLCNISPMDTVFIEVYFDGKKVIASPVAHKFGYDAFSFSALPGKHKLKITSTNHTVEKTISICLMKYLLIDYHGDYYSFITTEKPNRHFAITEGSIPITVE